MHKNRKVIASVIAAVALLAGAGSALADDGDSKRTAFRDAVAAKLGITPAQLHAAITAAAIDRIDAAVASGKLSAEKAAKLKQALADGKLGKLRFGLHKHKLTLAKRSAALFRTAAEYVGLDLPALKAELKQGKSLADVAAAQGKSADGLVATLLEKVSDRLDTAVDRGRISDARKQELLAKAKEQLEKLVVKQFASSSS